MEDTNKPSNFSCSRCRLAKPASDFPHAKGIRHSWCRSCHSEAKKSARLKLRETVLRKKRIASDIIDVDGNYVCSKCNLPKEKSNFQSGVIGGQCRECRAKAAAEYRRNKGVKPKKFSKVTQTTKVCVSCDIEKLHEMFSKASRGSGGLASKCKECQAAAVRGKNLEAKRRATALYREVNRESYLPRHRLAQFKRKSGQAAVSDGTVSKEVLAAIYATEKCSYCCNVTEIQERTLDHVTPLKLGGKHSALNIVMACRKCNSAKGATPVEKFLTRLLESSHDAKR